MISTGRDGAAAVLTSLLAQHNAVDSMTCNMDLHSVQLHPIFLNLASVACVTLHLPVNKAPTVHITIVVALSAIAHMHSAPSATAASIHELPDCTTDNTAISADIKGNDRAWFESCLLAIG